MPRRLLAIVALICLTIPGSNAAQQAGGSEVAVTLVLRVRDDQQQFRPGETIPVELVFSSPVRGRFVVDGRTYDRAGRTTVDQFRVEQCNRVCLRWVNLHPCHI